VHEEIAVIAQDPLTLFVPLNAYGSVARLLQLYADFIGDGLILARTRARADDKIIRETGDAGKIQNGDVRGFFPLGGANGNAPSGLGVY
jgi:hypothetical protein